MVNFFVLMPVSYVIYVFIMLCIALVGRDTAIESLFGEFNQWIKTVYIRESSTISANLALYLGQTFENTVQPRGMITTKWKNRNISFDEWYPTTNNVEELATVDFKDGDFVYGILEKSRLVEVDTASMENIRNVAEKVRKVYIEHGTVYYTQTGIRVILAWLYLLGTLLAMILWNYVGKKNVEKNKEREQFEVLKNLLESYTMIIGLTALGLKVAFSDPEVLRNTLVGRIRISEEAELDKLAGNGSGAIAKAILSTAVDRRLWIGKQRADCLFSDRPDGGVPVYSIPTVGQMVRFGWIFGKDGAWHTKRGFFKIVMESNLGVDNITLRLTREDTLYLDSIYSSSYFVC